MGNGFQTIIISIIANFVAAPVFAATWNDPLPHMKEPALDLAVLPARQISKDPKPKSATYVCRSGHSSSG